jgi:hypothetical protein
MICVEKRIQEMIIKMDFMSDLYIIAPSQNDEGRGGTQ